MRARQRQALSFALGLAVVAITVAARAAEPAPEPTAEPLTLQVQDMRQQATVFAPKTPDGKPTEAKPQGLAPQGVAPQSAGEPAPHKQPAVVVLHPGFLGDDGVSREIARALSQRGIIVVMPSYRGQKRALDGERSDGRIEFCSGEVDDAQHAVDWLRSRKDVDPFRIGLLGMSHGGCIALRTAIREPRLRAVVTFSAPVAAEPVITHLHEHPLGFFMYNSILEQQLERYIHGPPRGEPGSYAVRSPLFLAQKLIMPLYIVHGGSDHMVPTVHACWLARVLKRSGRSVIEHWLSREGQPLANAPDRCGLDGPAANTSPNAPRTELWLVEGQDHIFFSGAARRAAQERAVEFLIEELTR